MSACHHVLWLYLIASASLSIAVEDAKSLVVCEKRDPPKRVLHTETITHVSELNPDTYLITGTQSAFTRPSPIVDDGKSNGRDVFAVHHNGPSWGWQVPSRLGKPEFDGNSPYKGGGHNYVYQICNGAVGVDGEVANGTHFFAMDAAYTYRGGLDFSNRAQQSSVKRIEHHDMLLNTVQVWGHNYYHFIAEILPKVVTSKFLLDIHPALKLLIPAGSRAAEFLVMLDIPFARVIFLEDSVLYTATTLYLPKATPIGQPPRESLIELRKYIYKPSTEPIDFIVVIKREGTSRKFENYNDMVKAMETAFPELKIVIFRGVESTEATRAIFARAKIIVGPHGAGMTNMIFSPQSAVIMEVMQGRDPNMCYWHFTTALGMRYSSVVSASRSSSDSLTADASEIVRVVKKALAAPLVNLVRH